MKNYIRRNLYRAHVAHQEILAEENPLSAVIGPKSEVRRRAVRSRRRLDFWLCVAHYFGA